MVWLVVLCPHGHLISHFQIDSFAGSLAGAAGVVVCAAGGRASLLLSGNCDGAVKEPRGAGAAGLFSRGEAACADRGTDTSVARGLAGMGAAPCGALRAGGLLGASGRTCSLTLRRASSTVTLSAPPAAFAASTRRQHRICSSSPEDRISSMRSCAT